jgi:phosphatidylinositol alpha-mannosyltransferase
VTGLARALTDRGHRVTVFAPIDDPGDAPVGIDLVVAGHSVALPANGSRAPVSISPRAAAHAVGTLRRGGFDVVHVHEPFSPGLPYALLLARGVPPLVATFHRSGGSFFYSVLRPLARRRADHRFAARCAVSEAARQTADKAVGGEYTVLFNGVEIERFRDADPWPTDGPTVLFLGRHEERKGLRILLEAFAILAGIERLARRRRPSRGREAEEPAVAGSADAGAPAGEGGAGAPPILWIAGNGPETEWLQRLHPESAQIHWLGILNEEEKVRRLAAADVLCAPSLGGESFGMVLLEAMAARTLVVASDIDGYRDAVGDDAVLVPPGEPAALADALATALAPAGAPAEGGDDPRTARLDAGAARAGRWSMSDLATRYEAIYRDVVVVDPA